MCIFDKIQVEFRRFGSFWHKIQAKLGVLGHFGDSLLGRRVCIFDKIQVKFGRFGSFWRFIAETPSVYF